MMRIYWLEQASALTERNLLAIPWIGPRTAGFGILLGPHFGGSPRDFSRHGDFSGVIAGQPRAVPKWSCGRIRRELLTASSWTLGRACGKVLGRFSSR
jgi:hypothetical protein